MSLIAALRLPPRRLGTSTSSVADRAAPHPAAEQQALIALMRDAARAAAALPEQARTKAAAALAGIDAERKRMEASSATAQAIRKRIATKLQQFLTVARSAGKAAPPSAAPVPATSQGTHAGMPKGQVGHVAAYDEQGAATWEDGVRTSENEHVIAKGKQQAVTFDPSTGKSDYTDAHYRQNTTLRVERETALNKTHEKRGGATADNAGTKRLKAEARNPKKGISYREEVFDESVENMKRAARETKSKATEGQIHEAALAQDGELFGIQRLKDTGQRIAATADEVEHALKSLDLGEAVAAVAKKAPAAGLGARALRTAGKVAKAGGEALGVGAAFVGGYEVGKGIDKMAHGQKAQGAVDVGEGAANLGLTIGTAVAVKSGHLVAEGGIAAGGLTVLAGVAAVGSVGLAAETVRAAIRGEDTPIDVADEFYGTHFGDLHGWITGVYSKKKK
jgi:hypothetical protein